MASTLQEKVAWCSDISECFTNLQNGDMLNFLLTDPSAVSLPYYIRSDPKLFCDRVDIKFSRSSKVCRVPQIRHASVEKLLDHLIDLRFLSIEFLNTFLLTYRLYTTGHTILNAIKRVYRNPDCGSMHQGSSVFLHGSSFDVDDDSLLSSPPPTPPLPQCVLPHSRETYPRTQPTGTFELLASANYQQQYRLQLTDQQRRNSGDNFHTTNDQRTGRNGGPCLTSFGSANGKGRASRDRNLEESTGMEQRNTSVCENCKHSARHGVSEIGTGTLEAGNQLDIARDCRADSNNPGVACREHFSKSSQLSIQHAKLAPIASCETFSDNLDATCTDDSPTDNEDQSESSIELSKLETTSDLNARNSPKGIKNAASKAASKADECNNDSVVAHSVNNQNSSETLLLTSNIHITNHSEQNGLPDKLSQPTASKSPADASVEEHILSMNTDDTYSNTGNCSCGFLASEEQQITAERHPGSEEIERGEGGGRSRNGGQTASSVFSNALRNSRKSSAPLLAGSPMSSDGLDLLKTGDINYCCHSDGHHASRDSIRLLNNCSKNSRDASPSTTIASNKQFMLSSSVGAEPMTYRWNESLPGMTSTISEIHRSAQAPLPSKHGRREEFKYHECASGSFCACGTSSSELSRCAPCAASTESLQVNSCRVGISERDSKRRSSSVAATAVTTSRSKNLKEHALSSDCPVSNSSGYDDLNNYRRVTNERMESCSITSIANMRVLSILAHWIAKHLQDFDSNAELKDETKELLEEMAFSSNLLASEQRLALALLQMLNKHEDTRKGNASLQLLLSPPPPSTLKMLKDNFDQLTARDIAEQMTHLDHQIFASIRSDYRGAFHLLFVRFNRLKVTDIYNFQTAQFLFKLKNRILPPSYLKELLGQAWMKADKATRASHVLLVSKRFNEASRLVVSEIMRRYNPVDRAACIEKWAAIADICRCFKNYNGVLQICAAFVNSSIFRLKKTWEKISKQSKQVIEKLQTLVSSDGRFKNMREALRKCDPPCIPYLGMYLTDLSFIEEGTPNTTDDGLVNFSKMRMIAHVIREIQLYQSTPYKIECRRRVTAYLLDTSQLLEEEDTYRSSLEMEPRTARTSIGQLGGQLSA